MTVLANHADALYPFEFCKIITTDHSPSDDNDTLWDFDVFHYLATILPYQVFCDRLILSKIIFRR